MSKNRAQKEKKRKEKRKQSNIKVQQERTLTNLQGELGEAVHANNRGAIFDLCHKILRISSNHTMACELLVSHCWDGGDLDGAYVFLQRLVEKKNPNPHDIFFMGEYHYLKQHYQESLTCFNEFLALVKRPVVLREKTMKRDAKKKAAFLKALIKDVEKEPKQTASGEKKEKPEPQNETTAPAGDTVSPPQKKEAPHSSLSPLPKPEEIDVSVTLDDKDFVRVLTSPPIDDAAYYRIRLEYHHLSLLKDYDELLCPDVLPNVKKFWYQIETVKKILRDFRGRVLLADEVGLGKTIEACMGIKEYMMRGLAKKILILTPSSLVTQWKEELDTKFDLNFITTEETNFRNNPGFWKENNLIIASLHTAKSRSHYQQVTAVEYDLVVVDEAHHLKNRATLSWKLINALKKKFIFLLSATPVQNNLIELYNLLTLLKPGVLKTESEFKKHYMKRGNPRVPLNRETLKNLLRDVMIRNTRSLIDIKLPKRFAVTIRVNPSSLETEMYKKLHLFIHREIHEKRTVNRMVLTTFLREAGSSPFALRDTLRKYDHPELKEIRAMAEEIKETEKGVGLVRLLNREEGKKIVFTQFRSTLNYLADLLSGRGIAYSTFHGGLTPQKKNRAIETFRDEVPVLLTTETGGEGRNMQFANTIINYDLPWNPMKIEQRIGRIHRIGQTKEVFVFNFCLKGSIEDSILDILDKKINMFELVIGEIDGILGNIEEGTEFDNIVFDLWARSAGEEERKNSFNELGEKMISARESYQETKALDRELFGEDFLT